MFTFSNIDFIIALHKLDQLKQWSIGLYLAKEANMFTFSHINFIRAFWS